MSVSVAFWRVRFGLILILVGILMWNEFQFSDNYYPVIPEFLETVREETLIRCDV